MATLWVDPEDTIDPSGAHTLRCIEAASWLLYKLTAEKYPGTQTVTEAYSDEIRGSIPVSPTIIQGKIFNVTSSDYNRKLLLRHQPVLRINSISVNNTVLNPASYQLRNNAFIVRTDKTSWNLSPLTELIINYDYGLNPPSAGKNAALILANEFIRYHTFPSQCSLPERVTSVSRQNVSFSVLDPHTFLNEGKVGIYLVDSFITTANPSRAKKRPKVYSPDRPNGERIN